MANVYSETYTTAGNNYLIFINATGSSTYFLDETNTIDAVKTDDTGAALNTEVINDVIKITFSSTDYLLLLSDSYLANYDLTNDNWNIYNSSSFLTNSDITTSLGFIPKKMSYFKETTNEYIVFENAVSGVGSYNMTTDTWHAYNSGTGISYDAISNGVLTVGDPVKIIADENNIYLFFIHTTDVAAYFEGTWYSYNSGNGIEHSDPLDGSIINDGVFYQGIDRKYLVIAGEDGKISYYDTLADTWTLYSADTWLAKNDLFHDLRDIEVLKQMPYTPILYAAGQDECIASFDGTTWNFTEE